MDPCIKPNESILLTTGSVSEKFRILFGIVELICIDDVKVERTDLDYKISVALLTARFPDFISVPCPQELKIYY